MRGKTNNILAIDPGTREMGFASFDRGELEDYGIKDIRYVAGAADILTAVEKVVLRLIDQKRPRHLVVEKNNFSQIRQNIRLTMAVARIRDIGKRRRIRVIELDPRTVRKAICQDGNATKRELARTVAVRYPELRAYLQSNRRWRERYYQNAFDAIACGLTFLQSESTLTTKPGIPDKSSK